MSTARTIFAITFVLLLDITLIVPALPPAQLLYEYLGLPQTTLSIWEISLATLLNGIINGLFWAIIVTASYGLAHLALRTRKTRPLPPMPAPPRLITPPLEDSLVDSWGKRIASEPAILPTPPPTMGKEPARAMIRTEPAPITVSKEPIKAEMGIKTIDGIGPVRGALFKNSGIDTVNDLLRAGATKRGRDHLANEVGVTPATVLKWVHQGDLLRVRGIGRKYSALLESAGVNTITDLPKKSPRHLCRTLKAVNKERNLVGRTPRSKTIEIWVQNAKNLEPISVAHTRGKPVARDSQC